MTLATTIEGSADPEQQSLILELTETERFAAAPYWINHCAAFGRVALHELALGLNQASVAWDNGDEAPARTAPDDGALKALPARNPAYRWAASEGLRHGILWSPAPAFEGELRLAGPSLTLGGVFELVHRATAAQVGVVPNDETLLKDSRVWDFLFPTWSPQYLMARSSALRVGQALWMFRDAPRARKRRSSGFDLEALERSHAKALGMSVERFIGLVLLIYGRSITPTPAVTPLLYAPHDTAERFGIVSREEDQLLLKTHLASVIRVLGADAAEMKAWMEKELGSTSRPSDLELLRAPNPLLRFPLLRPFSGDRDHHIAPVPSCLLEWLYEPMVNVLHAGFGGNKKLATDFAFSFEEYVGMLLEAHSPGGAAWLHEDALRPTSGASVIDWARPLPESVVLVDAKRCFLEPMFRYRLNSDDWDSLEKGLRRGVEQAATFWTCVRNGEVPALAGSSDRPPIFVLVSQSDTAIIGMQARIEWGLAELAEQRCPGMKVVLVSLDQLQHIATNWQDHGDLWLERLLRRIAVEGRGIISSEAPHQAKGPLWDEVERIWKKSDPGHVLSGAGVRLDSRS